MSKKAIQAADANSVMARMGLGSAPPHESEPSRNHGTMEPKNHGSNSNKSGRGVRGKQQVMKTGYVHKSYYVTPEQHRALQKLALEDDRYDISGHLRRALNKYLGLPDTEPKKKAIRSKDIEG